MSGLSLDPAHSALLVMDFQVPVVENYAPGKEQLLDRTEAVLQRARATGMQVIYVVVSFRPGFPEISPRNQTFSGLKARGGLDSTIHPRVAPQGEEAVVTKRRVGAFWGTDMEVILRAKDVDTLVLAGISTSGVVLSTLRHAADADYRLLVLRDCCADPDAEVHACLLDKVFPRQASVIDSKELLTALS